MRIGIEAFRIFRNHKHGMDIAAIEQIKKLQQIDKTNKYHIFCFRGPDHFLLQETENFKIIRLPRIPGPIAEQLLLPLLAIRYQLDILHSTGNTAPVFLHCKRIITLHDIIYLEKVRYSFGGSIYQRIGKWYRRIIVPRVIKKADRLITVSLTEQQTISSYVPEYRDKILYLYNAVSSHFHQKPIEFTLTSALKYKLPTEPYILYHGNTDPKKNTSHVLIAFHLFTLKCKGNIKLVITDISAREIDRIIKKNKLHGLRENIHLTHYVHNSDMPDLYNRALFFLYPSLRESFGIPLLEAMACGTPVITSNTSAMPEIAADSALLTDPYDPEAMAEAMFAMYTNNNLRQELCRKGKARVLDFSWYSTGKKLLNEYQSVFQPEGDTSAKFYKNKSQPELSS